MNCRTKTKGSFTPESLRCGAVLRHAAPHDTVLHRTAPQLNATYLMRTNIEIYRIRQESPFAV